MSEKTATILGATGMTGNYLLGILLKDPYFDTVRVIVRRPYPKSDPKMEVKLVDFNDAESFKLALEGTDALFCCIGTTRAKVKGDLALYRKIDYDIPVKAARFCKEVGCEKYIIMSSIGANSRKGNFYLKLKGEVEDALQTSGLAIVHIMNPSMLLGDRKEQRPGERIAQSSMRLVSGLLMGSWRKYRAIHAKTVAAAMANVAKKEEKGFFRYTYDAIVELGKGVY